MTLPAIAFHDLVIAGQMLDPDRLSVQFANFLSYAPERRWTVFHEEMAKQQRVLETLADGIGLKSPHSLKVLEGLATKLRTYRRWIGLQKVPGLVQTLVSGAAMPDKLVIYCTSAGVMQELYAALKDYGPVMMYHDTPLIKRESVIKRFIQRRSCRVFLSTVTAASIAIDLSVADTIVFAEADWDPLLNLAAVRRCYRESAHKIVKIHFVGLKGSIDQQIARLFKQKTRQLLGLSDKPDDIFSD